LRIEAQKLVLKHFRKWKEGTRKLIKTLLKKLNENIPQNTYL